VFSIAEIKKGIEQLHDTDAKKQNLTKWLENDLNNFFSGRVIAFDYIVADKWGFMVGKINKPVATMDSLIAAISFTHNLKLVTRNVKDFEIYPIEIFNPWETE
jgi:predicted nucleic acid-binding protein